MLSDVICDDCVLIFIFSDIVTTCRAKMVNHFVFIAATWSVPDLTDMCSPCSSRSSWNASWKWTRSCDTSRTCCRPSSRARWRERPTWRPTWKRKSKWSKSCKRSWTETTAKVTYDVYFFILLYSFLFTTVHALRTYKEQCLQVCINVQPLTIGYIARFKMQNGISTLILNNSNQQKWSVVVWIN